jgi:TolB-like protein
MSNKFCRHLALLLAFAGMSLSNAFSAIEPALSGPRNQYTLAVLPLEASGRITTDEANILTERLAMELERTGLFIVSPQSAVTATLANGGAGCSTMECGMQAGRQLGVQLVANGSVRKVGQLYFVDAQIIHVKSGQAMKRVSENLDGSFEQLQNLMATVARKLVGTSAAGSDESSAGSLNATDYSGAASSGAAANSGEYRNGGNKILIYGLVAVGAVGAAVGITQLTKSSDNKSNKPAPSGPNLPNPPSFP